MIDAFVVFTSVTPFLLLTMNEIYQLAPAESVMLEQQGCLFKASVVRKTGPKRTGRAKRGKVCGFSEGSRRRMLEFMSRFDENRVVMMTLTYGQAFPSCDEAKRHLFLFLKRLRRLAPKASAVWRMEFQERGAPHFHLVLFSMGRPGQWVVNKKKVQSVWGDVITTKYWDHSGVITREPFTRIESLRSIKQVIGYVSKYMAKVSTSGYVPLLNPVDTGVDSPLRSETTPREPAWTGRVWGTWGRALMPFASTVIVNVIYGKWFERVFNCLKFTDRYSKRETGSFKVFSADPGYWMRKSFEFIPDTTQLTYAS